MKFENYAGKKILVLGGLGFLGAHLVRQLQRLGAKICSLGGQADKHEEVPGVVYIHGELTAEMLRQVAIAPDAVFHLAGGASVGASIADPTADFRKTVYSSLIVLEHARVHWPQTPLLYVSSAAVYGNAPLKIASHDAPGLPISPYGVHKKMAEDLLVHYGRMYGLRSVIVRPFSVYGPGLAKQLLWDALQKADNGISEFFGSGQELRDWVFVDDVVACLCRAINYADACPPIFNAGAGKGVSVQNVLEILLSEYRPGAKPVFLGEKKAGDPDRLVADDTAETRLGTLFVTPIHEGLSQYITWYKSKKHDA